VSGLKRPEYQRIGDDFLYTYGVQGIRLELSGITDSRREGFHAQVVVRANVGKLSWGRLKLDSDRERASLARSLSATIPDFPWMNALTQIAEMTFTMFREGEPTVRLTDVPAPREPSYLADPLLPLNETTILYGDGDAGKSTVALWIALCVALGRGGIGFDLPRSGPVLYVDWETNAETHARRLRRLAEGMGVTGSLDVHYRRVVRPVGEEIRNLQHEVHRLGAVLVVVDSLGFCTGGGYGESINDSSVATAAMNALRSLNVTRLALHHISHAAAGNGNGSSAPTGSRYFRNAARCLWEIQRSPLSPDLANIGLYNRKMNDDGKREQPIAWQMDYGESRGDPITLTATTLTDDPDLLHKLSIGEQIAIYLKTHGRATVGELTILTNSTDRGVRKALRSSARFVELDSRQGAKGGSEWGLRTSSYGYQGPLEP
jgi:AAA domain